MENDKSIVECESLEEWLMNQKDNEFPKYYPDKGQKSYPDKYNDLKNALVPIHANVEKGAMLESVNKWRREIIDELSELKKVMMKIRKLELGNWKKVYTMIQ